MRNRKPNGYWTYERCAEEALKYETRADFQRGSNSAYLISIRNGWLDEICEHMVQIIRPKGYWTYERCKAKALLCTYKTEFNKKYSSACGVAKRNGWYKELTSHMKVKGNKKNRAIYVIVNEELKQAYIGLTGDLKRRERDHFSEDNDTRARLITGESGTEFRVLTDYLYYKDARRTEGEYIQEYERNGYTILNQKGNAGMLGGTESKWTFEQVQEIALQYDNKNDFRENDSAAYNAARRHGWYKEATKHMPKNGNKKPRGYWNNKEHCAEEALKYKTRAEFAKCSSSAYNSSLKHEWLDAITSHMISGRKRKNPPSDLFDWS